MMSICIAKIPKEIRGNLYCRERCDEISSCISLKVKRQKFYAWALLESCAQKLGFNSCNLHFFKLDNGKWKCSEFEFSISHSEDYVAVILSDVKVGIDIQKESSINVDLFANKILTQNEKLFYSQLDENKKLCFLLEKWTQKECVYKMLESKDVKISQINCEDYPIHTQKLNLNGETYHLSYTPANKQIEINLVEI